MSATLTVTPIPRTRVWAGWALSGLAGLFLLLDGVMKLFKPTMVVEATTKLGYAENTIVPLGVVLTASTLLYLYPRTAFWGAILLTGYLGGAVDVHVREGDGAFNTLFPVILGAMIWGGLALRDRRVSSLL
jgi:hypothetical protein